MTNKLLILVFLIAMLSGCAVYDPKRGIFVSSSIVATQLQASDSTPTVIVGPFMFPSESEVYTQQSTFMVNGIFLPVSHSYTFDNIDQDNLRQSLIISLEQSGIKTEEIRTTTNNIMNADEIMISATFNQSGISSTALGGYRCILTGTVSIVSQGKTRNRDIEIMGSSMGTVSGAKNDAISQFIRNVDHMLQKLEYAE